MAKNSWKNLYRLFIVLAITLTMGLQFSNFKEGFDNKGKKDKNKTNNQGLPVHTKKSGSMAKQSVFDDMMPSY